MPKPTEILPGTLDMLILKAVSLNPLHGYGVLLRIRQISNDALEIPQGSLYPALYRLEHQGLIAAFHRAAFIEQLRQEVDSELSVATDVIPAELKQLFERAISKTVAKSVVSHPFHTIK